MVLVPSTSTSIHKGTTSAKLCGGRSSTTIAAQFGLARAGQTKEDGILGGCIFGSLIFVNKKVNKPNSAVVSCLMFCSAVVNKWTNSLKEI